MNESVGEELAEDGLISETFFHYGLLIFYCGIFCSVLSVTPALLFNIFYRLTN